MRLHSVVPSLSFRVRAVDSLPPAQDELLAQADASSTSSREHASSQECLSFRFSRRPVNGRKTFQVLIDFDLFKAHRLVESQNQRSSSICHRLTVIVELLQPVMRCNASLNDQNDSSPLALPFVLRLGNLCVCVSHHGNQHVDEQNSHDGHVENEENLE